MYPGILDEIHFDLFHGTWSALLELQADRAREFVLPLLRCDKIKQDTYMLMVNANQETGLTREEALNHWLREGILLPDKSKQWYSVFAFLKKFPSHNIRTLL